MSVQQDSMSTASALNLLEAKRKRQGAQREQTLLSNRIRLLQEEEKRTRQKIEETRKRTQEVLANKKRVEDQYMRKKMQDDQKRDQLDQARAKFVAIREQMRMNRRDTANAVLTQRKSEWSLQRQVKAQTRMLNSENQTRRMEENSFKRNQVRTQSLEALNRKKKIQELKRQEAANEYWRKVAEEESKAGEAEANLLDMELLEMELIKKLQNTQQLQKQAYQDLESALAVAPSRGGV